MEPKNKMPVLHLNSTGAVKQYLIYWSSHSFFSTYKIFCLIKVTTSDHEIIPGDGLDDNFELKFIRRKTVFGDTGWYGCANINITVENKDYNDPNASLMYVFVRCECSFPNQIFSDKNFYFTFYQINNTLDFFFTANTSAFAINVDQRTKIATVGSTLILPCRPTAREYYVNLEHEGRVSCNFNKNQFT